MTKGSILLRAALFFCSSLVFLSENFTSERFFITPVGYLLHLRRDSKFLMFSSNVSFLLCLHVKDRVFVKCPTLVHFRVQECNLCF